MLSGVETGRGIRQSKSLRRALHRVVGGQGQGVLTMQSARIILLIYYLQSVLTFTVLHAEGAYNSLQYNMQSVLIMYCFICKVSVLCIAMQSVIII